MKISCNHCNWIKMREDYPENRRLLTEDLLYHQNKYCYVFNKLKIEDAVNLLIK